jgi:membrane protein required for colicin V production
MIDILIIITVALAAYKGFQKGLIVALFSFVASIIGLAAAVKLSALVAEWLGTKITIGKQWLPVISFAIVFLGVVIIIRQTANLVEKSVKFAMLGWVNKLGGIVFYILLYATILSVVLFYAIKLQILAPATVAESNLYYYIKPLGAWFIESIGVIIPFFKDVFQQLSDFFEGVANHNKPIK